MIKCRKCIRSLVGLPAKSVGVRNDSSEVVNKFCYFGDIISAAGVEESIVARIRCGWKVFSLCTKSDIFQACVRTVILILVRPGQ